LKPRDREDGMERGKVVCENSGYSRILMDEFEGFFANDDAVVQIKFN